MCMQNVHAVYVTGVCACACACDMSDARSRQGRACARACGQRERMHTHVRDGGWKHANFDDATGAAIGRRQTEAGEGGWTHSW